MGMRSGSGWGVAIQVINVVFIQSVHFEVPWWMMTYPYLYPLLNSLVFLHFIAGMLVLQQNLLWVWYRYEKKNSQMTHPGP